MVKLVWEDKNNITNDIEKLKKKYLSYFKKIDILSSFYEIHAKKEKNSNKWKNKLFWGENLEVLYYLLNDFEEKIDLIYIDPPFFSGSNYNIQVKEADKDYETVAYFDKWEKDFDSYLQMLHKRIVLFHKLLTNTGLLFIHLDWHASHYIKLVLDEVFGQENFINNIIWYYYNKYSAGKKNLPRAHDDILVYSKTSDYTFNELRMPRKKPRKQLKREMVNGVLKNVKGEDGHVVYRIVKDKKMDDVWKIPCMQPASKEWTGFPTQKHHQLLERIIKLGSNKGDLIADFFCGSGTTLLAAEKLSRKWIGCDISEYSIYLTRKRIMSFKKNNKKSAENNFPFELYTKLDGRRQDIIESGFFEKELIIERKK
ncbi:MAG: site-specific DNA-methyltransferase [Promethearchaeota archaeon]|nr:MAG: site-specific DNA-methyltransferase [Candidatus Lokiarchaeota archaeon]